MYSIYTVQRVIIIRYSGFLYKIVNLIHTFLGPQSNPVDYNAAQDENTYVTETRAINDYLLNERCVHSQAETVFWALIRTHYVLYIWSVNMYYWLILLSVDRLVGEVGWRCVRSSCQAPSLTISSHPPAGHWIAGDVFKLRKLCHCPLLSRFMLWLL